MPQEPTIQRFSSFDGCSLAYFESGKGSPVVLLHGFAADSRRNWFEPGIYDAIRLSGRRVIALDARGHGESEKPHDAAAYAHGAMVRDAQCLLDHLGLEGVDVCGYSMGAITTLGLSAGEKRLRSIMLGGLGAGVLDGRLASHAGEIADALEAEDPATITSARARAFRAFADATGADRVALAAIQRSRRSEDRRTAMRVDIPAMVIAGARDDLVGDPRELAERIGAEATIVAGNHLTAIYAPEFTTALVEFLRRVDAS